MPATPNTRKTPRIQPYVTPCRILVRRRMSSGYLTDLSLRGVRVTCEAEPPGVGSRVTVEVRFGEQVKRTRLPGEVKWAKRGAGTGGFNTFGVIFGRLPAAVARTLESVVEEFRRRAETLS